MKFLSAFTTCSASSHRKNNPGKCFQISKYYPQPFLTQPVMMNPNIRQECEGLNRTSSKSVSLEMLHLNPMMFRGRKRLKHRTEMGRLMHSLTVIEAIVISGSVL